MDYLYLDIDFHCSLHMVREHRGHDGVLRREYTGITGTKGFWRQPQDGLDIRSGLIIPCDRSVTDAINDFLDMQVLMSRASKDPDTIARGPYYFSENMQRLDEFENPSPAPPLMGGPDTAYAGQFRRDHERPADTHWLGALLFGPQKTQGVACQFNPQGLNMARHNCWTGAQGIAQYIGGADIGAVFPELATAYRAVHAIGVNDDFRTAAIMQNDPDMRYEDLGRADFIVRRTGVPPVISVEGRKRSFDKFMDIPAPGYGRSPAEIIEDDTPFCREPAGTHAHMAHKRIPQPG